ncbi:hypothetical protein GCM10010304_53310 [Streptomyces roseoviolaceus]
MNGRDRRMRRRFARLGHPAMDATFATVDLDKDGWLLSPEGDPVRADELHDHFASRLRPPDWATDIIVYAHGWQTSPRNSLRSAQRLLHLMHQQHAMRKGLYPGLGDDYAPWTVVVRWPSSSSLSRSGYSRIRDRAHAMSVGGGYAAHVLGHLLGYLDSRRGNPRSATLQTAGGQYLHLVGHSFGGRFLCEAVTWAAGNADGGKLGWSVPTHPARPFTVDSLTVFQMAAPVSAFDALFEQLRPGPLGHVSPVGGPLVFTHSRHDRATGYWHLRKEGAPGIGHSGMRLAGDTPGIAPSDVWRTRLLPADTPYPRLSLDHVFVNIDASWLFRSSRLNPVGAHSNYFHAESAHLLLSLADLSCPDPAAEPLAPRSAPS